MKRQDKEFVLAGDETRQREIAKRLNVHLTILGKEIPIIDQPSKRATKDCVLRLSKPEHLLEASRQKHIRFIFGLSELSQLPLLTHVVAKQLKEHNIALLLPYPPSANAKWQAFEFQLVRIFDHVGVDIFYAALSPEPLALRGRYEKESYFRLILEK